MKILKVKTIANEIEHKKDHVDSKFNLNGSSLIIQPLVVSLMKSL